MTTSAALAAPPAGDVELVQRYAATGSAEAFATVVARHADFVFATALRQTRGDRDLAEDVTQATFIVLARRAGNLRAGTSVVAFLHQTVVYAAKNALRAKQRRRKHEAKAAIAPATPAASSGAVDADEAAVAVDCALTRLREPDRHLLMLHYFDGLSVAEAAATLRITHEAARKRLHRALDRLRGHLQGEGATLSAEAMPAVIAVMARPGVEASAATIASTALAGGARGRAFSLAYEVLRTFQLLALKKAAAAAIALIAVVTTGATVVVTQAARPVSGPAPLTTQAVEFERTGPTTTLTTVRRPPASRPAVRTLVDYPKVFDAMRRTMDERARLEVERTMTSQQAIQRAKQLGDLRRKLAATTEPAARGKVEAELRLASDENDEILRGQQAAMEQAQAKTMLKLFREIEAAIQKSAAAQGLTVPPFPPYPANIERMNAGQVRQYLMTKRFMPRPPGMPDLTEPVLMLLNQPSALATSTPATLPSAP